jgi:hypothetical protein
MRSTSPSTPAELANEVDAALLRDLAALAGIADPVVSPVDYAEVQLSVGCADESRACFEAIARAASVDALLVRSLSTDDAGSARLELRYFDSASSDEPAVVSTEVPAGASDALVRAMPSLVRELFGIPEVVAPAQSEPAPASDAAPLPAQSTREDEGEDEGVSIVPWLFIGAGAATLTAGIVVGAIAAEDFNAWKKSSVGTTEEADRANDELDDLNTRALAADILMPAGAVMLGLGATLLMLELSDDEDRTPAGATLAIEAKPGGALLRVRGTFAEAW